MSYNGSGTFNINTAGQPVVTGTVISSTAFNSLTADLGTGLSTAITKDGQTVATARIPFAAGINSSLVTDATNTTTGSIITAGGVGIAKALFVGTTANIAGTTTLAGVTATSITDSGLTSGRVTFASTSGLLADAAALAWDGTSLSATKFAGALNGTVGATTAAAGAFTTLSATGAYVNAAPAISGFPLATQYVSGQNLFVGTPNTAGGIRIIAANNALTSTVNLELQGTQVNLWGPTTLVASVSSTGLAVTGTLSATGVVTFSNYGVGTATFNGSGVISSVSDETWKVKDGAPVDTDAMLNKLEPGYWYYNDNKKETFGKDRQLGFYAQNVNAAIGPEAAPEPETFTTKNEDGTETITTKPWGYYDRSVLAVTVMSLQKALATIESLTARITALEAK